MAAVPGHGHHAPITMETTSALFEVRLQQLGYELDKFLEWTCPETKIAVAGEAKLDDHKHRKNPKQVIWYIQEDASWIRDLGSGDIDKSAYPDNKSTSVSWYKRQGCIDCVTTYITTRLVDESYENLRFYVLNTETNTEEALVLPDGAMSDKIRPLDPDAPLLTYPMDEDDDDNNGEEGDGQLVEASVEGVPGGAPSVSPPS